MMQWILFNIAWMHYPKVRFPYLVLLFQECWIHPKVISGFYPGQFSTNDAFSLYNSKWFWMMITKKCTSNHSEVMKFTSRVKVGMLLFLKKEIRLSFHISYPINIIISNEGVSILLMSVARNLGLSKRFLLV